MSNFLNITFINKAMNMKRIKPFGQSVKDSSLEDKILKRGCIPH